MERTRYTLKFPWTYDGVTNNEIDINQTKIKDSFVKLRSTTE